MEEYEFLINTILIKLTNACNMYCKMCGQNKRNERNTYEYIELESILEFLPDNIEDMNICLWGGEPLLYPNIRELLYELRKRKCYKGIITNGYYLDKYINELIESKLTYLTVSIDGNEKTHNSIRKVSDAYSKAIGNIQKLVDEKKKRKLSVDDICININYTILGENIENMFEIANLAKEIGCKSITYNLPIIMNKSECEKFSCLLKNKYSSEFDSWRGYCEDELNIDCDLLEQEIKRIKYKFDKEHNFNVFWSTSGMSLDRNTLYKYFYQIESDFTHKICNISQNTVVINSNGDLLLCPDFTETIVGNINKISFDEYIKEIQKNERVKKFEGRMPVCARCCHRDWNIKERR